jgi:hypothetical protein
MSAYIAFFNTPTEIAFITDVCSMLRTFRICAFRIYAVFFIFNHIPAVNADIIYYIMQFGFSEKQGITPVNSFVMIAVAYSPVIFCVSFSTINITAAH